MAAIMVAFFGVVIAVNVLMARLATSTFGGVVVENSYVASQHFNTWLDEARAEKALGWKARFERTSRGALRVVLRDAGGRALTGARVGVVAEHPLGLRDDETLTLRETAPGLYEAPLAAGRWRLRISARAQGHEWRAVGDVQ
nr:FixH family protein [Novosphingobium huizhouense]